MSDPAPQTVLVPREGASDDQVVLIEITATHGSAVQAGQTLCVCETSKTALELDSPTDGHVYWPHAVGDRIAVGEACAYVFPERLTDEAFKQWLATQTPAAPDKTISDLSSPALEGRISKPALELARQHGVDLSALAHLHMIKRGDVQVLIDQAAAASRSSAISNSNSADTQATLVSSSGKPRLVIYGGGGHAKMCIDMIRAAQTYEIEGIVDGTLPKGSEVLGVAVLGGENLLPALIQMGVRHAVLGVGAATKHTVRAELYRMLLAHGFDLPNIVHPKAVIEPSAQLGHGNQIMAQAYIGSDARLGDNCIINALSIVSHDSQLGHNVHLAPGCVLAGGVRVGSDSLIGMNSSVYMKVKIGERVVIANQSSVLADVASDSFVRP
jgi:sugar O-acyltransferase (sialic acid O-acetyltransferase NeuD family)